MITLSVELEQEVDGRWIAEISELPGVLAYGNTPTDARAKAQALALRVVADRLENGEADSEGRSLGIHVEGLFKVHGRFHAGKAPGYTGARRPLQVKYLLDTNICIYIIKKNPERVFRKFREFQVGDVGISAITYSELEFGIEKSSNPRRNREALYEFLAPLEIAPYPPEAAPHYGSLQVHLQRKGRIIGPLDLLIAAHAAYLGCTLITNNTSEFVRVPNLRVENWA